MAEQTLIAPLVGRDTELTALAAWLRAERPGLAALVSGEAGMGKTRLLQELRDLAARDGFEVYRGPCYHVREAPAFLPFRQILTQTEGRASSTDERLDALAASLAEEAPVATSERQARIVAGLSEAVSAAIGERPVLLIIDDLHWADTGSLLVLNYLLDTLGNSFRIACSLRPDESLDASRRELLQRAVQRSLDIRLRPLQVDDVRELVKATTPDLALSQAEVADLRRLTNGNPMLLRELLLHLVDHGRLERHSLAEATRKTGSSAQLADVIDLRLQKLPGDVLTTLQVCSVLGGEWSLSTVARVTDLELAAAEDDLDEARQRGLLVQADAVGEPSYGFAHPLFAMRLYESMAPSERRSWHAKAAERYSCLRAEELARHFALGLGAEAGERGRSLCIEAASDAEKVGAYDVAAEYWSLALRCTESSDGAAKAPLLRSLGATLHAAGKWEQAVQAWTEAYQAFLALGETGGAGEVALAAGEECRWRQELEDAECWLQRAAESLPEGSPSWGKATALLGSIRCLLRDHEAGLEVLDAAACQAAEKRDPLVGYWLSYGYVTSGDLDRAYELAQESYAEAVRRRDATAARSLLARSLLAHELGRLDPTAAEVYLAEVASTLDPTEPMSAVRLLVAQAYVHGYRGEWRQVAELCETAMGRARLIGPYQLALVRTFWAEAQRALGNLVPARQALARSLPDMEEMRPLGAMHLARICFDAGDEAEALLLVDEFAPAAMAGRTAAAHAVLGEVVSRLDRPDLWRRSIELLAPVTRPLVMVYSPISVDRVRGRLAGHLKEWDVSFRHFDGALDQLAAGGALFEMATAFLDYADARRARGRRGDLTQAGSLELRGLKLLRELGLQTATRPSPARAAIVNEFGLSGRELEVLALLAQGRRNDEIAERLSISGGTVERHLANIYGKMGVANRTEAVSVAIREDVLVPMDARSLALTANGHLANGDGPGHSAVMG